MKLVKRVGVRAAIVSGYVFLQPLAGQTAAAQQVAQPTSANAPATQATQAADSSNPPYLNPALPFDQRVNDLISRMTVEEKCSQLVNQSRPIVVRLD